MEEDGEHVAHKFPDTKLKSVERTLERIKNSGSFGRFSVPNPKSGFTPRNHAASAWGGVGVDDNDGISATSTPRVQAAETPRRHPHKPPLDSLSTSAEPSRARAVEKSKRRVHGHGRHSKEYDIEIDPDDEDQGQHEAVSNARQLPMLSRTDSARASFSWPIRLLDVEQQAEKVRMLNGSGSAALLKGDVNEAKRCLEAALQLVKGGHASKHVALEAATFNNVGRLFLHLGKPDKAAALMSEAALSTAKMDLASPDEDVADLVHAMHSALSNFEERLADGTVSTVDEEAEMRLSILAQFARGAVMENAKGALECRESMRKAADMSRKFLLPTDPLVGALSSAYTRAKEKYEIGKAAGGAAHSIFTSKSRKSKEGGAETKENGGAEEAEKRGKPQGVFRRAAEMSWALQAKEGAVVEVPEDVGFGVSGGKKGGKTDRERDAVKKRTSHKRVHLGTLTSESSSSFGSKMRARHQLSSEDSKSQEGSQEDAIPEDDAAKHDLNTSVSSHSTSSPDRTRSDTPPPDCVTDEECADLHTPRQPGSDIPAHLSITLAPPRRVSVDESPVHAPTPRGGTDKGEIEDSVGAHVDVDEHRRAEGIADHAVANREEDFTLERHRSDVSIVEDLPQRPQAEETKVLTSLSPAMSRAGSSRGSRGARWQPVSGTLTMQSDEIRHRTPSAKRSPSFRDGVMRSEDLSAQAARRMSAGGKQWGDLFVGDKPNTARRSNGDHPSGGGEPPRTRSPLTSQSSFSLPTLKPGGSAANLMNFAEVEKQRLARKAAEARQKAERCLVVQCAFRMHRARRRACAVRSARDAAAAACLEAHARSKLARCKLVQLLEQMWRETAAKDLCARARSKLAQLQWGRTKAAVALQACCRRVLKRSRWLKRLKRRRVQVAKARILSAVARRTLLQKQFVRVASAIHLQAVARRCRCRTDFAAALQRELVRSALYLSCHVRGAVARNKFSRTWVSVALQSKMRRRLLWQQQLILCAAARLQAVLRRTFARTGYDRMLHASQSEKQAGASTRIVAAARMSLGRHQWGRKRAATNVLEGVSRASAQSSSYMEVRRAAQRAQALLRASSTRTSFSSSLAALALASLLKRSNFRGRYADRICAGRVVAALPRALCLRNRFAQHCAAARLQACTRAAADRLRWQTQRGAALRLRPEQIAQLDRQRADEERCAACCLQSVVRRALVLQSTSEQRRVMAVSMVLKKIQASVRMRIVRNRYRHRLAASPLAARIRMRALRRAYVMAVASMKMKAVARRALVRQTYARRLAAQFVQAVIRRRVVHMQRDASGAAGSVLTRSARRAHATGQHKAKRVASVVLLAAVRRSVNRQTISRQRQRVCVELLQGVVRRMLRRGLWISQLGAAKTIQAAARAKVSASRGGDRIEKARITGGAQLLQAAFRRVRMRDLYRKAFAAMALKARALANLFRQAYAKRIAGKLLGARVRAAVRHRAHRRNIAARRLQACARRAVCAVSQRRRGGAWTHLASCLQRCFACAEHKQKRSAAVSLQSVLRRQSQTGNVQAQRRVQAAAKLQGQARGRLAQDVIDGKRIAVHRLQAAVRCGIESLRGTEDRENARRGHAAVVLQARCRMLRMRPLFCKAVVAVRLKAIAHGMLGRRQHIRRIAGLRLGARVRSVASRRQHRRQVAAQILQAGARRRLLSGERDVRRDAARLLWRTAKARVDQRQYCCRKLAVIELEARVRRRMLSNEVMRMAASVVQGALRMAMLSRQQTHMREAATRLQAAARGKTESCRGSEEREQARRIRSAESLEAACRRQMWRSRHRREVGAKMLQARIRARRARREYLGDLSTHRFYAAIRLLQACVRRLTNYDPNEREHAASTLKNNAKRTLESRSFGEQRAAATQLQSAMRRQKERQSVAVRNAECAAERLQAHTKMSVSRCRLVTIAAAAEKLKAAVRGRVGAAAAEEEAHKAAAAAQLQARIRRRKAQRGYMPKLSIWRYHEKIKRLQACVRRVDAQRKSDGREAAGRVIASSARRRVLARNYAEQRMGVMLLQARVRCGAAQSERKRLEQEAAVQRIQAGVRARRAAWHLNQRQQAVRFLQACTRRMSALTTRQQEEHRSAARRAQALIRMCLAQKSFLFERTAAQNLQAAARSKIAASVGKEALEEGRRAAAAQRLQARYRMLRMRGLFSKVVASVVLKTAARQAVCRRKHVSVAALRLLQAQVRRLLAAGEAGRKSKAACKIACMMRGRLGAATHAGQLRAAAGLQALWRMRQARDEFELMRTAALQLQAVFRGKLAVLIEEAARRATAAQQLQARCRVLKMRGLYSKVLASLCLKTKAYRMLMRRWFVFGAAGRQLGRHMTRQATRNKYARQLACRFLQGCIRRKISHSEAARLAAAREVLCCSMKRRLVRQNHRETISAAIALQARLRGFVCFSEFAAQRRMGSLLQACIRRAHTAHHRRQNAGCVLQAVLKRCSASKRLVAQRDSTQALQACVRRRRVRDLNRESDAGRRLTFVVRMQQQRGAHALSRVAAVMLQAAARRKLQRGTLRCEKERRFAAAVLQAACRCQVARSRHEVVLSAVATLLAHAVANTIRRDYQDLQEQWAAHRLQVQARMMLAARHHRIRKEASTRLKAFAAAKIVFDEVQHYRSGLATQRLQAAVRATLARRLHDDQAAAAARLQAAVLAWGIYAEVQALRCGKMAARLQAAARRGLAQRRWVDMVEASVTLQSTLLGRIIYHEVRALREGREAQVLQAAVRRALSQQILLEHMWGRQEARPHLDPRRSESKKQLKYNPDDISDDSDDGDGKKKRRKKKRDKEELDPQQYGALTPVEAAFRDVKFGKYRAVEKALEDKVVTAETTLPDFKENTLLTTAALNGQTRIAKLLLRSKAEILHKNAEGAKASELAHRFNYHELGQYLEEKERVFAEQRDWVHYGVVTEGEAAFRDCQHGKYRGVEAALDAGIVTVGTQHYHKRNTLLHVAAVNGHARVVKLCLRRNAPMNLQNEEGNTPAHLAYLFNYKEVAQYLISKGAKANIRNLKGQTCEEMMEVDKGD